MDGRPPLAVSPRRLRPRPHRVPRPPLMPAASVQTPPGSMKKTAAPMRASVCAIPSPVRFEPSAMRASISALPSPIRAEPNSMRASMTSALRPPAQRVKLDLSPARAAAAAAEKENFFPAAAPSTTPPAARARAGFEKESLLLPAGSDAHDELVALNLAAIARAGGGPMFVRGRLYDAYSARRDERLKRKQGFPYYSEEYAPAASVDMDTEAMAEDPCVAVELSKRRVAKKAYTASGAESVRRSMPAAEFAAGRGGGLGPRSSLRSSKEMKKASAASGCISVAIKERRINPRSSARRF